MSYRTAEQPFAYEPTAPDIVVDRPEDEALPQPPELSGLNKAEGVGGLRFAYPRVTKIPLIVDLAISSWQNITAIRQKQSSADQVPASPANITEANTANTRAENPLAAKIRKPLAIGAVALGKLQLAQHARIEALQQRVLTAQGPRRLAMLACAAVATGTGIQIISRLAPSAGHLAELLTGGIGDAFAHHPATTSLTPIHIDHAAQPDEAMTHRPYGPYGSFGNSYTAQSEDPFNDGEASSVTGISEWTLKHYGDQANLSQDAITDMQRDGLIDKLNQAFLGDDSPNNLAAQNHPDHWLQADTPYSLDDVSKVAREAVAAKAHQLSPGLVQIEYTDPSAAHSTADQLAPSYNDTTAPISTSSAVMPPRPFGGGPNRSEIALASGIVASSAIAGLTVGTKKTGKRRPAKKDSGKHTGSVRTNTRPKLGILGRSLYAKQPQK